MEIYEISYFYELNVAVYALLCAVCGFCMEILNAMRKKVVDSRNDRIIVRSFLSVAVFASSFLMDTNNKALEIKAEISNQLETLEIVFFGIDALL